MSSPRPLLPKSARPQKLSNNSNKLRPNLVHAALSEAERTPLLKRRSVVYAIGVAAIAGAGALIGATLKTWEQQEQQRSATRTQKQLQQHQQPPQPLSESNVRSRIEGLEYRRGELMKEKMHLEKKIADLQERQRMKKTDSEKKMIGMPQRDDEQQQ